MKKLLVALTLSTVCCFTGTVKAQPGPHSAGPNFSGVMSKLYGEHQTFAATVEIEVPDKRSSTTVTMPGKLQFDHGKSRMDMNMSEVKGGKMPPNASAQLKAMGMDSMIVINRNDLKVSYLIYPGLESYLEHPLPEDAGSASADDLKVETTELGKETIDGHACVKNQVIVTGKDAKAHESTVWNATDLGKFPLKIVTQEDGQSLTIHFKDVTFAAAAAGTFEVTTTYKKYTDIQTMMQEVMMKKMGGGMMGHP
ncbi:MAG TPA: DUF4412 domain-containing protein [Verrucomicrobiae bacterium]